MIGVKEVYHIPKTKDVNEGKTKGVMWVTHDSRGTTKETHSLSILHNQ